MILLLVTAALVGWWMWTSLGGSAGTEAMPGGGPQQVIQNAEGAVKNLNDANQKMQEAIRQATPPPSVP